MIKPKILITLLAIGLLFNNAVRSQDLEIGLFGGGSYYLGELNPGKQFTFTKPAFGGVLKYAHTDRWTFRINVLSGKVAGDDAVSKVNEMRNLRFTSSITEISAVAEFNFFPYFTGSNITYFTPYLFVGPGFFFFNPKAEFQGEKISLRDMGTEGQIEGNGYNISAFAAVFGMGFKYSINGRLGLGLEWGLRKSFTDYIDDISTTYYVDFDKLSPGEIGVAEFLSDPSPVKHKPGMQRGNSQNNDWYSFAGVTLSYRFSIGEKSTCSDFEKSKN
jgi:hypothetical protein